LLSGNDFSGCFGRNRFGLPRWTIIHSQSMGGHIAIASLELHPDVYQGALIECGVIDGVGLTDWPYAYTGAAECFSGLPLLDLPRPEFGTLANGTWLGLMGEPGYYTERGRRFDSVVKYLSGGDVPLRLEGLLERYVQDLNPRLRSERLLVTSCPTGSKTSEAGTSAAAAPRWPAMH
jgi:hypothetical protein